MITVMMKFAAYSLFLGGIAFSAPAFFADSCVLNIHRFLLGGFAGHCLGACAALPNGVVPDCDTKSVLDAGGVTWYSCLCGGVAPAVDCDAEVGVKGNLVQPVCRVNLCVAPQACVPFAPPLGFGQSKPVCDCKLPGPPPGG